MDETPAPLTRIEQFNQLVRALIVLLLTGGFLWGFIITKVVNTESFSIVLGLAITWWFKSRDDEHRAGKTNGPPAAPIPPPTTGG